MVPQRVYTCIGVYCMGKMVCCYSSRRSTVRIPEACDCSYGVLKCSREFGDVFECWNLYKRMQRRIPGPCSVLHPRVLRSDPRTRWGPEDEAEADDGDGEVDEEGGDFDLNPQMKPVPWSDDSAARSI